MIVSVWTIYWAIGMGLVSFILDYKFAAFIRANTKYLPTQFSDAKLIWIVFFAVCVSAFFWPFMLVPRKR